MKKLVLIIALIFLSINYVFSQNIIINEIMFAPENGEPEWIELYNCESVPLALTGFQIWDSKTGKTLASNTPILELGYCLICKDTTLLKSIRGDKGCAYIQLSIPSFNNDMDAVVLKSPLGVVIDSVYYEDTWGKAGKSLERKYKNRLNNFRDNWFASVAADSATCGFVNSISPKEYDLALKNSKYTNDTLSCQLCNVGERKATNVKLKLYSDKNDNGEFSEDEIIKVFDLAGLDSAQNMDFIIKLSQVFPEITSKGEMDFKVCISCDIDKDTTNNYFNFNTFVPFEKKTIIINEIMFDTDENSGDYVELQNMTNEYIDISGWKIGDSKSTNLKGNLLIDCKSLVIPPNGFALVVLDTNFYNKFPDFKDSVNIYATNSSVTLNATNDAVVLYMRDGTVCDSVIYDSKWAEETLISTKNISLERIGVSYDALTKSAWASSADSRGGSPLKRNSCYYQDSSLGDLTISPNPVSFQKAPGRCFIKYSIKYKRARLNANIYNLQGERVVKLLDNELIGQSGYIFWGGKNSDNYDVEAGAYILLFEANDTETGDVVEIKKLIVVAPE